jgi:hypothetical protein
MTHVTTLKLAEAIAGTLGFPSKMPGTSYGIPASLCNVGSKLRQVSGSTCADCYAFKNNYQYPSVRTAQERRYAGLTDVRWTAAMVFMLRRAHGLDGGKVHKSIKREGVGFHRWHDSGDLQGVWHLMKIVEVAKATPEIRHWLPIRETGVLLKYEALGLAIPSNLTVRVSAPMVDGAPASRFANTSTVHDTTAPIGWGCPAPRQGNVCGPCRKCWDPAVQNVGYQIH